MLYHGLAKLCPCYQTPSEMRKLEPDHPGYAAKFTVLMENVEHHVEEEEKEMFPQAKKLLRDQLDDLGQQMEQRKEQLTTGAR